MRDSTPPLIVNTDDAETIEPTFGRWGSSYKVVTPAMRPAGGSLGVSHNRLSKGHATCPFHYHLREDEVFYILSGRGVFRYGDTLRDVGPGDCISCPAGTKTAHQLGNPHDDDLVYLAIGPYDPHEVCVYPDSGKILVRSEGTIGRLDATEYMTGEADIPPIFDLID